MARIGEMKCWNPRCNCADVAVHQTAGGKLSAKCHRCQFEHWGPVGTKGHRDMQAETTLDEAESPPAAPEKVASKPEPAAKPAPAPRAPRSVFELAQL